MYAIDKTKQANCPAGTIDARASGACKHDACTSCPNGTFVTNLCHRGLPVPAQQGPGYRSKADASGQEKCPSGTSDPRPNATVTCANAVCCDQNGVCKMASPPPPPSPSPTYMGGCAIFLIATIDRATVLRIAWSVLKSGSDALQPYADWARKAALVSELRTVS